MMPPAANGLMPPAAIATFVPVAPNNPLNKDESPPAMPLATGFNAAVTVRLDSRSASDLSTSSNCLPPLTDWLNARVIAPAKPLALTVRLAIRACAPSSAVLRSAAWPLSNVPSAIGIPRHQIAQRRPRERRAAPGQSLDRKCKLTWRHAPELLRRKAQDAEPDADRFLPGERLGR